MKTPLIEFCKVTKRFGDQTVLDNVDMSLYEGEVSTIIGKSGVGKSVLLKHIIGLLQPDAGEILLHGQPINTMSKTDRKATFGRISYMFQNNALFDSLTVYENIAMPLRYTTRLSRSDIDTRVLERIRQTELVEVTHKYPAELSGGMQKRVALARALVTNPEIVLFDEPTTGQDPIRRNAILSMIAQYQHELGFTAVLISHDLPDVFFISNRIIALYDGAIVFQGTPEDFDDFEHPFRYEFIRSLETLQEELTGLYTRRHFKTRYQTELNDNPKFDDFAMLIITIDNLSDLQGELGYSGVQVFIQAIGTFISKHFSEVGGFSTRYSFNQYTTMLPYADMDEARSLAQNFAADFTRNGIPQMQKFVSTEMACKDAVSVTMRAGVAQGKRHVEIDTIIAKAESNQETLLEFNARCKGIET